MIQFANRDDEAEYLERSDPRLRFLAEIYELRCNAHFEPCVICTHVGRGDIHFAIVPPGIARAQIIVDWMNGALEHADGSPVARILDSDEIRLELPIPFRTDRKIRL